MDYQPILSLLLAIVYRGSKLNIEPETELIEGMLDEIVINNTAGGNPEAIRVDSLKSLILEIMHSEQATAYDQEHLVSKIEIALTSDEVWADSLTDSITDKNEELTKDRYMLDVQSLRFKRRQTRLSKVLKDASYMLMSGRVPFQEVMTHAKETVLSLEDIITDYSEQDKAIVSSASTRDRKSMIETFENASRELEGDQVYKLPFDDVNIGLQGGVRLTDTIVLSALQHHYKSGMTMQTATGIPQINEPVQREGKGKPALVRISFEDSLENNFLFMYNEMYHNKYGTPPDPKITVTDSERADAVIKKLTSKGWEVDFLRTNPSGWTYRDIQNYVETLETEFDLDVQVLVLDYLMLIPTTGCITTGPMGTDKRDLLRRMRNWGAARSTCIITPHQLNTTAKAKQREDIPAKDFLQHIKGCGMYADSGQLDQEFDIGILLHRVKHNGDWWLNVVIEKHRFPKVIDDAKKATYIPFSPNGMPLLADMITGKKKSLRRLPTMMTDDF